MKFCNVTQNKQLFGAICAKLKLSIIKLDKIKPYLYLNSNWTAKHNFEYERKKQIESSKFMREANL